MKQQTQSPAIPVKKYVPYGMNGMYFVYDNESGQIPMNYGTKGAIKSVIQRICNDLNAAETTTPVKDEGYTESLIEGAKGIALKNAWKENERLLADNKELIEALKDLTDRAEKARGILQSDSSPSKGFWGVLDTAGAKEAIKKHSK